MASPPRSPGPVELAAWAPALTGLAQAVVEGYSSVLVGPRSSGVSSLLTLLLNRLQRDKEAVVHRVDLDRGKVDPVRALAQELGPRRTPVRGPDLTESVADVVESLLETARRRAGQRPLVVALDQVHALEPQLQAGSLAALRAVQDRRTRTVLGGPVSVFVIAGAIDPKGLQQWMQTSAVANQSCRFLMPRLTLEDLSPLFDAWGEAPAREWPDEVRRLVFDLCGDDLGLVTALLERLPQPSYEARSEAEMRSILEDLLHCEAVTSRLRQRLSTLDPREQGELAAVLGGRAPPFSAARVRRDEPGPSKVGALGSARARPPFGVPRVAQRGRGRAAGGDRDTLPGAGPGLQRCCGVRAVPPGRDVAAPLAACSPAGQSGRARGVRGARQDPRRRARARAFGAAASGPARDPAPFMVQGSGRGAENPQ